MAAHRWAGSGCAALWPPFFDICCSWPFCGGIAYSLSRRRGNAIGALGPFGDCVAANRAERIRDFSWQPIVIGIFIAATWGTIFALGWRLAFGLRGACGAVAGSFAGYLALVGLVKLAPGLVNWPWRVLSYFPQPTVLLDGILTSVGLGLGIYIVRRNYEQRNRR